RRADCATFTGPRWRCGASKCGRRNGRSAALRRSGSIGRTAPCSAVPTGERTDARSASERAPISRNRHREERSDVAIQSRAVLDRDRNDICVSAAIYGVCAAEVDGTTTLVPAYAAAAAVIRRVHHEPPRRTASVKGFGRRPLEGRSCGIGGRGPKACYENHLAGAGVA